MLAYGAWGLLILNSTLRDSEVTNGVGNLLIKGNSGVIMGSLPKPPKVCKIIALNPE